MPTTTIGIIGLGYVGLPLAVEFKKKYLTIGFDQDKNRINELKNGFDKTMEVSTDDLKATKNLKLTYNIKDISACNVYIITVPTPVDKYNIPDMSPLASASIMISSVLKKNDIVIYESTVYPGATEEFCVPILEKDSGLKYNQDFFCGYSPERINPGDKKHSLTTIPKVTSGSNEKTANFIDELYKSIIIAGTFKASSIAVAEAAKVIENIQRDVNIALINELSMIFNKLGLDTTEVLETAGSKWNFLPFRPGLVGGHCIGVDPFYLTHKAIEIGYHPEIILAGRRINDGMSKYIADRTIMEMTKSSINPVGAKVSVFGLTFKENCPDLRNAKVPDIVNYLQTYGCEVMVSDPYADKNEAKNLYNIDLVDIDQITNIDVVIIAVEHNVYKSVNNEFWVQMLNNEGIFIDVKSVYSKDFFNGTNVIHWRL